MALSMLGDLATRRRRRVVGKADILIDNTLIHGIGYILQWFVEIVFNFTVNEGKKVEKILYPKKWQKIISENKTKSKEKQN